MSYDRQGCAQGTFTKIIFISEKWKGHTSRAKIDSVKGGAMNQSN